jgi:hypothetical protein
MPDQYAVENVDKTTIPLLAVKDLAAAVPVNREVGR